MNNDFFNWANHEWLATNKIPTDEIRVSRFNTLQNNVNSQIIDLLKQPSNESNLINKLMNSFNTTSNESLYKLMDIVNIITNHKQLIIGATSLLFMGIVSLFNLTVDIDILLGKT